MWYFSEILDRSGFMGFRIKFCTSGLDLDLDLESQPSRPNQCIFDLNYIIIQSLMAKFPPFGF